MSDKGLTGVQGDVKLSDYGLYAMTEKGNLVDFAVGEPSYLAPEAIIREGEQGAFLSLLLLFLHLVNFPIMASADIR